MDNKVVVLLSSYNGEKYITEQIESILSQTYKSVELFVRDDGSTDGTLKILKKYAQSEKLKLIEGHNIGFLDSFIWLLKQAHSTGKYMYYSFSDQDDIWFNDKIERAVNFLNKTKSSTPALYHSNFDYYDEKLNFITHSMLNSKIFENNYFSISLTTPISLGFTMVLNNPLVELGINSCNKIVLHDYFFTILAASFGIIYSDDKVTVKYRRHLNSVSLNPFDFIEHQIWRYKQFFFNKDSTLLLLFKNIYSFYGNSMKSEDRKLLELFVKNDKYSICTSIKKAFYNKRYRISLLEELAIRIAFLIGAI